MLVSCETVEVNPVGDSAKDQKKLVNYVHSLVDRDIEKVMTELLKQGLKVYDVPSDGEVYVIGNFENFSDEYIAKSSDYYYYLACNNGKISCVQYHKFVSPDEIYSKNLLLPISTAFSELKLAGEYKGEVNGESFNSHISFYSELASCFSAKNCVSASEYIEGTLHLHGKWHFYSIDGVRDISITFACKS